jgi:Dolichyl-phosphate-mannose-protein mannosyltransferase
MPTQPADRLQPRTPWWNPIASKPSMVWFLIFGLLALRVLWQYISPYTLIEDEAHYWEWSRRLDWSYYSKGPGIAWLIWLSTTILGHSEFAIRIPAAIAAALGTIAIARVTKEHFVQSKGDQRLVFISAVLYACVPGFAVAAMIMTIDSPYIACWAFASLFAIRAILKGSSTKNWIAFGLWIAIGFIFKYTILLLLPGVLLALFVSRRDREKLNVSKLAIGLSVSLLGLVPVLIWNASQDWATVRHLLGHLGAPGGDTQNTAGYNAEPWTIVWSLEYIALQILVGGPVLFLAFIAHVNAKKRADQHIQTAIKTCIALALPMLVFYFIVSLVTQTEGNWAMAAFVTLIPPASWAIVDGVTRMDHPIKFGWGFALGTGMLILLLFPGASWIAKQPGIGKLVPLYRMTGMREHAAHTQRIIDELRETTGLEPLVMSKHYGRASLLAFYLEGNPIVYCTSAQVGGRKTQYDLWRETDLTNPDTLDEMRSRPGILFGGRPDQWSSAFEQLTDIGKLDFEPEDHKTTYTGLNFTSFATWNKPTPQTIPQSTDSSSETQP